MKSNWFKQFLQGYGSVLNLNPNNQNPLDGRAEGLKGDAEAIASDWAKVGQDFKTVLEREMQDLPPEYSKVIDENYWDLF